MSLPEFDSHVCSFVHFHAPLTAYKFREFYTKLHIIYRPNTTPRRVVNRKELGLVACSRVQHFSKNGSDGSAYIRITSQSIVNMSILSRVYDYPATLTGRRER